MTKEEKARAYDEALKDMRVIYPNLSGDAKLAVEHAFPQLTESEDERIIEGFYTLIRGIRRDGGLTLNKVPLDKCEAWLEKQKDLDKMIVVSPEVWDKAIADAYENGKKEGEKQKEQKPAECSDEDKRMIEDLIRACHGWAMGTIEILPSVALEYEERLKSIRLNQSKKASDIITPHKKFFQWIYDRLVNVHKEDPNVDYMISFKERIEELSFDAPSWKPSEEQIKAFKKYIEEFQARAEAAVGGWNNFDVMIRLYEQLKKL